MLWSCSPNKQQQQGHILRLWHRASSYNPNSLDTDGCCGRGSTSACCKFQVQTQSRLLFLVVQQVPGGQSQVLFIIRVPGCHGYKWLSSLWCWVCVSPSHPSSAICFPISAALPWISMLWSPNWGAGVPPAGSQQDQAAHFQTHTDVRPRHRVNPGHQSRLLSQFSLSTETAGAWCSENESIILTSELNIVISYLQQ